MVAALSDDAPSERSPRHTPTPWQADPDDREGYEWNIHILDETGVNRICFMSNGPATEANAEFIVNAVNNHEALVKALMDIRQAAAGPARSDIAVAECFDIATRAVRATVR